MLGERLSLGRLAHLGLLASLVLQRWRFLPDGEALSPRPLLEPDPKGVGVPGGPEGSSNQVGPDFLDGHTHGEFVDHVKGTLAGMVSLWPLNWVHAATFEAQASPAT